MRLVGALIWDLVQVRTRAWLWLTIVWRRDDYWHQPAARWTIREAWFVAGVIAQTCLEIRRGA